MEPSETTRPVPTAKSDGSGCWLVLVAVAKLGSLAVFGIPMSRMGETLWTTLLALAGWDIPSPSASEAIADNMSGFIRLDVMFASAAGRGHA